VVSDQFLPAYDKHISKTTVVIHHFADISSAGKPACDKHLSKTTVVIHHFADISSAGRL